MTALNGWRWGFCCGRKKQIAIAGITAQETFFTQPHKHSIHTETFIYSFAIKAVLFTYPDSAEGNVMLLQVYSVQVCTQPPS